jgi:hypothetical protein
MAGVRFGWDVMLTDEPRVFELGFAEIEITGRTMLRRAR